MFKASLFTEKTPNWIRVHQLIRLCLQIVQHLSWHTCLSNEKKLWFVVVAAAVDVVVVVVCLLACLLACLFVRSFVRSFVCLFV